MSLAIVTKNLTKTYSIGGGKSRDVVDNLNLEVKTGEIFGFLGPNGAGKTTTIKILLGIIRATSGEAYVLDKVAGDVEAHRRLSYLPEKPYYYEHMTGLEIISFYASLFGIKDIDLCKSLLEKVNLHNDMNRPIAQYSRGMQQRIGLAQSLINDPELLFLDEPTAGLDPIAHIDIRNLILQFREDGKTVFISSHELSDIERICDRVAIINHGVVIKQGELDELLAGGRIEITVTGLAQEKAKALNLPDTIVSESGKLVIVDMPDSEDADAVIDAMRTAGGKIVSVIPRRRRLEDLFLESVGASFVKGGAFGRVTEAGEVKEANEDEKDEVKA